MRRLGTYFAPLVLSRFIASKKIDPNPRRLSAARNGPCLPENNRGTSRTCTIASSRAMAWHLTRKNHQLCHRSCPNQCLTDTAAKNKTTCADPAEITVSKGTRGDVDNHEMASPGVYGWIAKINHLAALALKSARKPRYLPSIRWQISTYSQVHGGFARRFTCTAIYRPKPKRQSESAVELLGSPFHQLIRQSKGCPRLRYLRLRAPSMSKPVSLPQWWLTLYSR